MTRARAAVIGAFAIAVIAGAIADRPAARPPLFLGGYRVVAADFHTHDSMWSDGELTPWGMVLEARRHGLDAIAITGHNEVLDAKVGKWFSTLIDGPTVIVGQEILAPGHHVVALGVDRVVDSREPVAKEIDDVHAQGGVAIAAHPIERFWPAFDQAAMERLDGAEICHPVIFETISKQRDLERFAAGWPLTAIGSSDFHGLLGRMGACRTYVFARDASAPAILDALRAHRTVVYGLGGKAFGDPALVQLASTRPELRAVTQSEAPATILDWISRLCGAFGLVGLVMSRRRRAG